VATGTSNPKILNISATTIDNDGGAVCGSTLRESVTYSTALNQVLTSTVSTQTIAGNVITGPTTNQANIGIGGDYANAALYVNVSELQWTYAFNTAAGTNCTAGNASAARYGSLNMSCQITFDRQFSSIGLSGTVFNDGNGLTDSTVNGTGNGTPGGTTLYANLVDTNGNVVSVTTIAANGTYSFPSVVAGNYTVRISTVQGVESSAAPALTLPSGWVFTGENLGAGAGSDGTINGSLPVTASTSSVTNANFGIERLPVAGNSTLPSQSIPIGNLYITIPPNYFSGTDADASSSFNGIRITQFPSNIDTLRINGVEYNSSNFPVGGVNVPTNSSGQPTVTVEINPQDNVFNSVIPYRITDNAGYESSSNGTVTAPFLSPTASQGNISGTLNFGEMPLANALVVLLNLETGQKIFTRTDASGSYIFEANAVGNDYLISPLSSKYSFAPANKFVSLTQNAEAENFSALRKLYHPKNDFDGDGISDIAVFRAEEGNWFVLRSSDGEFSAFNFGMSGDIPVAGDFDGDGKADHSVFRPSDGNWYIFESDQQKLRVENFGSATDKLVAADYDGDGKTDVAVYRDGQWFVRQSIDHAFKAHSFGTTGDTPTVGDFDGDGRADFAVYRPSAQTWFILESSTGSFRAQNFGLENDIPSASDFDGDGRDDIAQFRSGNWFVLNSTTGFEADSFGTNEDLSISGDFDGDGRDDLTVYRNGEWFIKNSSNGAVRSVNFGLPTDIPIN